MSRNVRRPFPRRSPQRVNRLLYLLVMLGLLLSFWVYAWYIERVNIPVMTDWLNDNNLSILAKSPQISFALGFFHKKVLRHIIPVLVGWYFALDATVILVRSLYDLPDRSSARRFLRRLLRLVILPVKAKVIVPTTLAAERDKSALLRVGGPGKVAVPAAHVMVTEINGRFHHILPAGTHSLTRYEYIHALLNLQPQERSADNFAAYSRDGIELRVGINLKYRIKKGQQGMSKENPYPYDKTAVRTAAYSQTVIDDKGKKGTWEDAPLAIAKGMLGGILAGFHLDEVIFPEQQGEEPYRTLQKELRRKLRGTLDGMGINLQEVAITRLDLPSGVDDQVIDYWRSNWQSQMMLKLVDGEATAVEELEIARAEAEMTMIQAILEGVQRARREGATAHMDEVVALRLVDALEMMARQSQQAAPLPNALLPQLDELRKQLGDGTLDPKLPWKSIT